MENQIYLNILISLILSTSISYFYLRKINVKFLIYAITIFLISFTIFYLLGPQNNDVESFKDRDRHRYRMNLLNKINQKSKSNLYESVDNIQEEVFDDNQEELNTNEEVLGNSSEEYNQEEETYQEEETNQEEELNQQEEHIRKSIEEEEELDEEDEIKPERKSLENNNFLRKIFSGNHNQINPGIGIGVSPVNIYINGDKTSVDKFGNNKGKSNQPPNDCSKCTNNDNYFKKASRIYNNSDWIYDKPQWCSNDSNDEKYNYDKNDYLLPNSEINRKVNKIPQTLNEAINSKKPKNKSEPCPLDVNKPWSNFKTGDDKESGEIIPDGFNL